MNIQDTRALVTGAAGGIGGLTAEMLARAGARVLLVDRDASGLTRRTEAIVAEGGRAAHIRTDLACSADRLRLVDRATAWEGGINTLINVAGLNDFALLGDCPEERIEAMLAVNVLAPVLLCKSLVPVLQKAPQSHIINIGSTFGTIGFPGFAVYSATKFAVRGFTQALRRELADTNIRVQYVAPRATRTAINPPEVVALNQALGVAMDPPENVARAVLAALQNSRCETYLGWPEKLFVRINSLFPGLVDRSLRKQLPIVKKFACPTNR